ncbi:MAG: hypothetical protein KJ923_03175 [Candidatus Omnitrophica bacterium]|nr:hypothetical protein [Candidatus Omnitrophota bacterium]MBU1905982.1 hypothetical protein [Candidatus Omnitrophota bacterium]
MKRAISVALVVFFLAPVFAFTQDATKESDTSMGMMNEKMMMYKEGKEGKEGMAGKHKMMMKGMMEKKMVATEDGGVAILFGNKLLKYDKNLKLIKEVEIDFMGMKKQMMEKCKMGKDMKEQEAEAVE